MLPKRDIIGLKFGRLRVISESNKRTKNNHLFMFVQCDCGNIKEIAKASITRKNGTKSCGCITSENSSKLNRLEGEQAAKNRLIHAYKASAKRRELVFELSNEQFFNLTQLNCHYCNIKPSTSTKPINPHGHTQFIYNGIDRIDDNIGYVERNVVPCCIQCNLAKNTQTYQQFIDYLNRVRLN